MSIIEKKKQEKVDNIKDKRYFEQNVFNPPFLESRKIAANEESYSFENISHNMTIVKITRIKSICGERYLIIP